jgi:hypothetical protein
MAIEITAVRFGGNRKTEDAIVRYQWLGLDNGQIGESDKPTLVEWIDKGNRAYVGSGVNRTDVGVVKPALSEPYLRTYFHGKQTNNLVKLPPF